MHRYALPLLLTIACAGKSPVGEDSEPTATTDTDTDVDGDGYEIGEDCDDTNASVHPDATEACDGVDNNCSGNENDAANALMWYADADGDGYGNADSTYIACDAPEGYLADATDCDDADAAVNPGATEVCGDVSDNDCEGGAKACGPTSGALSGADAKYTGKDWLEMAGYSVSTAGDVDGDGFGDLLVGSHYNDDGGDYAGAAYLVLGSATPGDLSLGSADAQYTGVAEYDGAGRVVATAGDVDGDGFGDILIGALGNDDGGDCAGAAYLVLGGPVPGDLSLSAADAQYTGEAAEDVAGSGASAAGDVDGDGFGDMLIGAKYNDDSGENAGAAYLLLGSSTPGSRFLGAASAQYTGEATEDAAGASVSSAGDIDGDGLGDILIAAPYNDDGGDSAGAVYLLLGSATPVDLALGGADAKYTGEAAGDVAGSSVSTAGDVDGDGLGDMLIGASHNDDGGDLAGAAYLVLGGATPGSLSLGTADAQYTGEASRDLAGNSVSTAGDVDGDGFGDILIGAYYNDDDGTDAMATYVVYAGTDEGAAHLVLGAGTRGSISLGDADATYSGETSSDQAGFSVSTAGDMNADGFGDLLIGAPSDDPTGAAYLVLGSGF